MRKVRKVRKAAWAVGAEQPPGSVHIGSAKEETTDNQVPRYSVY